MLACLKLVGCTGCTQKEAHASWPHTEVQTGRSQSGRSIWYIHKEVQTGRSMWYIHTEVRTGRSMWYIHTEVQTGMTQRESKWDKTHTRAQVICVLSYLHGSYTPTLMVY